MRKLLDLFCGGGGAGYGYKKAGFYVVGVDIVPQPRYAGDEFHQGDALEYLAAYGAEFDAIHASPPCQAYTLAGQQWRKQGKEYPDLIEATRAALRATGKPYVIENVPGAPLLNPTVLNGAFFGMNLRRTRMFETSFSMPFVLLPKEGASHFRMGRPPRQDDPIVPVGHFSNIARAREVMGTPWMTGREMTQAIPPAYTCFIGRQLMAILEGEGE
jgi:DNA (cytosine-5)-methyltransferase 1